MQNQSHLPKKGISNTWLTIAALFVMLPLLSFIYSKIQTDPKKQWGGVLETSLQKDLSGQTNFKPAGKNPDLKGKEMVLPVLMYHHIGEVPKESLEDELRKNLTVHPKSFEEQMAWLKTAGYNSITFKDLLAYTKGEFEMPKNPIIISFDDGYEDALTEGVSILKKYGHIGSFGIITRFPGIKYGNNTYAAWPQIKAAANSGMEIVSHTQDHFDGTSSAYDNGFILRNLKTSREDIKSNAGADTKVLVYPFGRYNEKYLNFVKEAGFEVGITTEEGKKVKLDNLYEIPRIRISGSTTLSGFKKLLAE